jgi:hypothetical protein
MPTMNIYLNEPAYLRWVKIAEKRNTTGAAQAADLIDTVLNDKALRVKLLGQVSLNL